MPFPAGSQSNARQAAPRRRYQWQSPPTVYICIYIYISLYLYIYWVRRRGFCIRRAPWRVLTIAYGAGISLLTRSCHEQPYIYINISRYIIVCLFVCLFVCLLARGSLSLSLSLSLHWLLFSLFSLFSFAVLHFPRTQGRRRKKNNDYKFTWDFLSIPASGGERERTNERTNETHTHARGGDYIKTKVGWAAARAMMKVRGVGHTFIRSSVGRAKIATRFFPVRFFSVAFGVFLWWWE